MAGQEAAAGQGPGGWWGGGLADAHGSSPCAEQASKDLVWSAAAAGAALGWVLELCGLVCCAGCARVLSHLLLLYQGAPLLCCVVS
jgi:hypothetical protein